MKCIVLTSAVEIEEQVSLYQSLSMGFLICGCVCLAAAITFFFVFRIANVIAVKTGHAERRTIKEIEESNAETGKRSKKERAPKTVTNKVQMWNNTPLGDMEETTLLEQQGEWSSVGQTAALDEKEIKPLGRFVIIRDITLLHTEECV